MGGGGWAGCRGVPRGARNREREEMRKFENRRASDNGVCVCVWQQAPAWMGCIYVTMHSEQLFVTAHCHPLGVSKNDPKIGNRNAGESLTF